MSGLHFGTGIPCRGLLAGLGVLLVVCAVLDSARAGEPAATDASERESLRDFTNAEVVRTMLTLEERRRRSILRSQQADAYLRAGRYAEALEEYRRALMLDPENESARTGQAQTLRFLEARPDVVGSATERLRSQAQVDQQHRLAEAEHRLARAERILAEARQAPRSEVTAARIAEYHDKLAQMDEAVRVVEAANLQIKTISEMLDTSELNQRVHRIYVEIARLRPSYEAHMKTLRDREAVRQGTEARNQRTEIAAAQRATLFEQATLYRDNMAWDRAESILQQILDMNPADQEARAMILDIRRLRRRNRADNIEDLVTDHRREAMRSIDRATILQVSPQNPLRYPRDWSLLVRRREARQVEDTDPQNRAILTELEKTYSFAFIDTPITDAFDMIRQRSGLNIIPRLNGAEGRSLNLDLRDMRLDNILRWIMRDTGLAYEIRRGAIYVTTPEALEGEMVMRVYDVRDIAYAVTDAHPPRDYNEGEEYDVDGGAMNTIEFDRILETVLAHEFSARGEPPVYDSGSGMLTVVHTEEVHRKVEQLLGKLRSAQAIQVSIATRFLTVTDDFWEEFNSNFYDFNTYGYDHPAAVGGQFGGEAAPQVPFVTQNFGWNDPLNPIQTGNSGYQGQGPNAYFGLPEWDRADGWAVRNYLAPTQGEYRFRENPSYRPDRRYGSMHGMMQNGTFNGLSSVFPTDRPGREGGFEFHIMQNGWLGALQNQWFVRMLKQNSHSDQLFAPHLVAYNNRYAWIRFRENRQYVHSWRRAAAGNGLEQDRRYLRLGSMLQVRPSVSACRKYVTVDIWPRTTQLTGMLRVEMIAWAPLGITQWGSYPIDLPTVMYHDTRTTATMPDGGAIVLTGMGVNVRSRERTGVPLIQDAPLVGNIFSSRAYQTEKRDYILLVSARMIILEEEEAKFTAF